MTYKERLIKLLQHSPTDAMGNHGVGAMADHLMDNGLVFKEMYDDIEERLAHQRVRATTAEHFICKLCAECDYEDNNGITTMILKCCSMFPECGKFKLRSGWIPVSERLPEEKTYVLISCGGNVHVARIAMGIDEQMRDAMKRGELSDPLIPSWSASTGYTWVKRSMLYSGCDVHGNNLVPYCWYSNYGLGKWFGQEVSHWMPLPDSPKEV